MRLKLFNRENGDTIIEVLIALSIIGLVVAGAYATANSSTRLVRQSQERSDAVKVAETQLEMIRSINAGIGSQDQREQMYSDTDFCYSDTEDDIYQYSAAYTLPAHQNSNGPEADGMPEECKWNDHYYAHVTYDDSDDRSRFILTVRWARLGGGVDEVVMPYGIYEAED